MITAVSDLTLKIWDSSSGQLLSTLHGHEDEIFVLEPHPISVNILLTAAHDGQICVWDIATLSCLYKYRNFIEAQVKFNLYCKILRKSKIEMLEIRTLWCPDFGLFGGQKARSFWAFRRL